MGLRVKKTSNIISTFMVDPCPDILDPSTEGVHLLAQSATGFQDGEVS